MRYLKILLSAIFISILFVHLSVTAVMAQSGGEKKSEVKKDEKLDIRIKTFKNSGEAKGWGYDIYVADKLYVHQPGIPAISGNFGFDNEKDAKKVAAVMVNKIIKHIMPPSVSIHELDSLGITKNGTLKQ